MPIHFYHPNKRVSGFAASFWYSDRDDAVFATILKQSGWDENSQNGTFKASVNDPNKKVNVKLSFTEVAGILDCIERNRSFSQYHDSDEKPKQIGFSAWMSKPFSDMDGKEVPAKQSGFSFTVTVLDKQDKTQKNAFFIGLTFAEARELREFLIYIMHEHFYITRNRSKQNTTKSIIPAETETREDESTLLPQQVEEPANNQAPEVVKDSLFDF